uniref:Uncharacterized protein n=1 Tax=Cacopsylla melanoneura TaxID=428564 RepID=A0A8D9ALK6_9HEMI
MMRWIDLQIGSENRNNTLGKKLLGSATQLVEFDPDVTFDVGNLTEPPPDSLIRNFSYLPKGGEIQRGSFKGFGMKTETKRYWFLIHNRTPNGKDTRGLRVGFECYIFI